MSCCSPPPLPFPPPTRPPRPLHIARSSSPLLLSCYAGCQSVCRLSARDAGRQSVCQWSLSVAVSTVQAVSAVRQCSLPVQSVSAVRQCRLAVHPVSAVCQCRLSVQSVSAVCQRPTVCWRFFRGKFRSLLGPFGSITRVQVAFWDSSGTPFRICIGRFWGRPS